MPQNKKCGRRTPHETSQNTTCTHYSTEAWRVTVRKLYLTLVCSRAFDSRRARHLRALPKGTTSTEFCTLTAFLASLYLYKPESLFACPR